MCIVPIVFRRHKQNQEIFFKMSYSNVFVFQAVFEYRGKKHKLHIMVIIILL